MAALPQECPSCHRSLADPAVPKEHAEHADLFTIAKSGKHPETNADWWQCPYCLHAWPMTPDQKASSRRVRESVPTNRKQRRQMAKAARRR